MPRGNDKEAALSELADKFGKGVGNAEELIEASLAGNSEALRKAELMPVDPDATRELKIGSLKGPDGEKVVSAKVRGGITVIVYEDDRGAYRRAALDQKGKVDERQLPPAAADFPVSADRPPLSAEHHEKLYGKDPKPVEVQAETQSHTQSKNDDASVDAAKGGKSASSKSSK